MADEQIIYLSPEEELTSVRERLERTKSRRIILVIPAQTQLRSHVSWRLLRSRARELNKDVLIISTDRQVRAVVKAAGFKIADSLESPPSGKPRSASRPGRPGLGGKTSARLRAPTGKEAAPSLSTAKSEPEQTAGRERLRPSLDREELDARLPRGEDDSTLTQRQAQSSATFDGDEQFGQGEFDYRINSPAAHLHPINQPFEDEEPNHVYEDYRQSQSIRQAALGDADPMLPPAAPSVSRSPVHDSPSSMEHDDPLTYLDDEQTVHLHLPEQRGSAFIHDVEDKVTDISSEPDDAMQIEDQGDMGDIVDRSPSSPRIDAVPGEAENVTGPISLPGGGPRTRRHRNPAPQPLTSAADSDDEMALPPVPEQGPPTPAAGAGNRAPEPVELPQARAAARSAPAGAKKRSPSGQVGSVRPLRPATRPRPAVKGSRKPDAGRLVVTGLILLALLALVLLAILLPSADVTVVLRAQTYSLPLTLTANAASRQDTIQHTLPAQTLVYDTSVQGTAKATGVVRVGTVAADGSVFFTNNNTAAQGQIDIPTGTTIATKNHVFFTTQADVLVQPGQTLPTTILAQQPGAGGNVAANTIVVLPADGLGKIQQANPGVAINLKVNNTGPTTHGGTGTASVVTSKDVAGMKSTLDLQVNTQIQSYLLKNVHGGDQKGAIIRDETPIVTPAPGSVAANGTFLETLKVHMTVLVVRAADLETAASAEMRNTLMRQGSGLALVPEQRVQVSQLKNTAASDGGSLALSFTATARVAAQITADTVRNLMAGKPIDYARNVLNGKNGTPNVSRTDISVHYGVLQLMPFIPQHITVHFQATAVPTAPAKH
jgi:hypothetical protein